MVTLLVVDDDRDIREALRDLLEGEGYQVDEAQDGRDACARLSRDGAPDLLVLDLMMPNMTGAQVLDWLREQPGLARLPVVVISAARRDVVASTLAPPVVAALGKPFPAEDLLREISRHTGTSDSPVGG